MIWHGYTLLEKKDGTDFTASDKQYILQMGYSESKWVHYISAWRLSTDRKQVILEYVMDHVPTIDDVPAVIRNNINFTKAPGHDENDYEQMRAATALFIKNHAANWGEIE